MGTDATFDIAVLCNCTESLYLNEVTEPRRDYLVIVKRPLRNVATINYCRGALREMLLGQLQEPIVCDMGISILFDVCYRHQNCG